MMVTDRGWGQSAIAGQTGVVAVESLSGDPPQREVAQVWRERGGPQPLVRANCGRSELCADQVEPLHQQLAERGGRRDLAGRDIRYQLGQRPLGLALGAMHHAAQLFGTTRHRIARQLHDQLP